VTALPRPLNANGRSRQRWERWRARRRAAVMARCRGRCEAPGCRNDAREAHHCFGRRHIIGEPLASHQTMLAGLCRDCHRMVTKQSKGWVTLHLRWVAIAMAAQTFTVPAMPLFDGDAIDAAKYTERHLDDSGELDQLRDEAGL
jgi:hypothetical protein